MDNYAVKTGINSKTRDLVISSLLTALVFIATKFINVRLPFSVNGGLIHLGTGMLFICAFVFGKKKAAIAGAVGMGIFDILSGWAAWSPFTFIIRGVMGWMAGSISYAKGRNGKSLTFNLLAILLSGIWMMAGYYITEVILYGNWYSPITSVPGNALQIVLGTIAALPISAALKRTKIA